MENSIKCITKINPQPPQNFLGREQDLAAVEGMLRNEGIVLVCGKDGIGKSTLCKALYSKILTTGSIPATSIGWLDFTESVEYTLYCQFPDLEPKISVSGYAKAAEEYLKRFGQNLVLFIDNVEIEAISFPGILSFLTGLGCKIVFVSTNKTKQAPSYYLGKLELNSLKDIFYSNCPAKEGQGALTEIIEALGSHTLAVELLSIACKSSPKDLQDIRQKLLSSKINESEHEKHIRWIASEFMQAEPDKLIQALSLLSKDPIGFDTVSDMFDINEAKVIFSLISDGWLSKASSSSFSLHPLIARAFRQDALSKQDGFMQYFSKFTLSAKPESMSLNQRVSMLPHAQALSKWMNNTNPQKARLLYNIALIYDSFRDYPKAQASFDRALSILSQTVGIKHPFAVNIYRSYGASMQSSGQYIKACQMYDKAADLCLEKYGADSIPLCNCSLDAISVLLYLDNADEALKRAKTAYDILKSKLGENSVQALQAMERMGNAIFQQGRANDALDIYESVLNSLLPNVARESGALVAVFYDIAQAHQVLGDEAKSYFYAMRALEIYKRAKILDYGLLAKIYLIIGKHYQQIEEFDQALSYMKDALTSLRNLYSDKHPEMSLAYLALGGLHRAMGVEAKAVNYFSQYLAIKELTIGKNTPSQAFKNIGSVYMELGNKGLTLKYYIKALNMAINLKGKNHPATAGAYNDLGLAYMYFGDSEASLENFNQSLKIFIALYGIEDSAIAVIYNNIAMAYQNVNSYALAIEYYARSLAIKEAALGKRDPHTLSAYSSLYIIFKKMGDLINADYYKTLYMENGGNLNAIEGELGY